MVVVDLRGDVFSGVPSCGQRGPRPGIGRLPDVPRADARTGHPDPFGQPRSLYVLAEDQRRHR